MTAVFELPENYEFVRALGKGAYGFVCLFKDAKTGWCRHPLPPPPPLTVSTARQFLSGPAKMIAPLVMHVSSVDYITQRDATGVVMRTGRARDILRSDRVSVLVAVLCARHRA